MTIDTKDWSQDKKDSVMNELNHGSWHTKQKVDEEVHKIKERIKEGRPLKGQVEKNFRALRNGKLNDVKVT